MKKGGEDGAPFRKTISSSFLLKWRRDGRGILAMSYWQTVSLGIFREKGLIRYWIKERR